MIYFILGGLTAWVILSCIVVFILDQVDPCEWSDSILFTVFFPAAILVGIYDLVLITIKKIKKIKFKHK